MYKYNVMSVRVIDGDSLEATLDRGMNDYSIKIIRMYGINAPESRTRDKEEKVKGLASKDWLISRIHVAEQEGYDIVIQSHKKKTGKYGRLLGTLYIGDINVNVEMVQLGLAVPYHGGKR